MTMPLVQFRPLMHQAAVQLRRSQRILLIAHQRPDGDTLGSLTAVGTVLKNWGKEVVAYCADAPGSPYQFLPMIEKMTTNQEEVLARAPYDAVVICDASDLSYTKADTLVAQLAPRPVLINIDHHRTNTFYGDINIVVESAASTTQVVTMLMDAEGIAITSDIATSLLTGLVTDTGVFTNPATTSEALETAAMLVRAGARYRAIIKQLVLNRGLSTLHLWAAAFDRLSIMEPWELAVTGITLEDQRRHKADDESTEGIANFLNSLAGVKAVMVLRELPFGKVKGSLRTTRNDVDVSLLAKRLGGGGHKKAAGFMVEGRVKQEQGRWRIV